ncbi:sialidase family protein [Nonomuraea endophytica]|uniref:exo-alpha-sialidase n=1 Tax=Nonomuraea endophytica TaxID=714136 RepID=A0A7W8AD95_9ACTN|nr:sialidase family protein [Nonomuraea endophytica]MBB5084151.1 sialidase-1 [Nonomuraea endophytica]
MATVVFAAGTDYPVFRIPAIVRAQDGTLVAFAEGRQAISDTGNIDVVCRRSSDGGQSWGPLQVVTNHGDDTAGNPAPVVLPSGRILLLTCRNAGAATEHEIMRGTAAPRRVYLQRSDDSGATWSAPAEITAAVKQPAWRWYATGPGHGIVTASGRIVVGASHSRPPAAGDTGSDPKHYGGHCVYSDDQGANWRIGFTSSNPNGYVNENETTLAELPDGRLYFNCRDRGGTGPGNRADAYSRDGGQTLEVSYRAQATIVTADVQASVLALPGGRLLYSGPSHLTDRAAMGLRVSEDAGQTWQFLRHVSGVPAAYSDLVHLGDAGVGLLYETGNWSPYDRITFTTLPGI